MNSVYNDSMTFWHPFMSVRGKQDMLGVARLWTFLNGHLEIDIKRVGEGQLNQRASATCAALCPLLDALHCIASIAVRTACWQGRAGRGMGGQGRACQDEHSAEF